MATKERSAAESFATLAKLKAVYAVAPTDMLKLTIKNLEIRANAKLDSEMAAKEKSFMDKHQGADWWLLASQQYPITITEEGFTVTSNIFEGRDTWSFSHKFLALEKVQQLVKWKAADREKGWGDVDADLEHWSTEA